MHLAGTPLDDSSTAVIFSCELKNELKILTIIHSRRVNTACVRRTMPLYDFRQGFNCDAVLVTNKGNDKRAKRECNKLEMHLRQAMSAHREHNDDSGHATESSDVRQTRFT